MRIANPEWLVLILTEPGLSLSQGVGCSGRRPNFTSSYLSLTLDKFLPAIF